MRQCGVFFYTNPHPSMTKHNSHRQRRLQARLTTKAWEQARYFATAAMPRLLVDPEFGDKELVRCVEELAVRFDPRLPECRGDVPENYFLLLREYGFDGFQDVIRRAAGVRQDHVMSLEDVVFHQILGTMWAPGNWLFEGLPEHFRHGSLVRNFFYVAFTGDDFIVRFRVLETASSAGGTVYIPPSKPTVPLAGRQWGVALHAHALERLCERFRATPRPTYLQNFFLWTALSHKVWKYEPIELNDGQPALRVLTHISCNEVGTKWHDVYVKQILGEKNVPQHTQMLAVVVGYLPLQISGNFARALTFLFPGYRNTPEAKLVEALPPGAWMQRRVRALAKDATFYSLFYRKTAEAIKWYHEHGVPQVFPA